MATTELLASCSFCLKAYTDVGTLVAGPGVYICDECVALCSQLIADKPKSLEPKSVQRIAPWEAEAGLDEVLSSLPRVAKAGNQAEYPPPLRPKGSPARGYLGGDRTSSGYGTAVGLGAVLRGEVTPNA
jgi:hypothetical protein